MTTDNVQIIQTPFNIEAILQADKVLLAYWKIKPFYFDIGKEDTVVIKYLNGGKKEK